MQEAIELTTVKTLTFYKTFFIYFSLSTLFACPQTVIFAF